MNHIDRFLLDDDLESAERHAATCAECRQLLDDWQDIAATAKTLRMTWESELHVRSSPAWWHLAAAVLLTVAIGATAWYAVRKGAHEAAFDQEILRVSALDEVERTERAHLAAIEQLEKVADPRLDEAESPLLISYKEKLLLLDDAIAECRSNVDQNRQNAHLRKQLVTLYSEKQRTLQEVVREGTHE